MISAATALRRPFSRDIPQSFRPFCSWSRTQNRIHSVLRTSFRPIPLPQPSSMPDSKLPSRRAAAFALSLEM